MVPTNDTLRLGWTIVLDGVSHSRTNIGVPGRMDHMAYDPKTHRLFVAALENGSLEVIDAKDGRRVGSIAGLEEPQGVALIPDQSAVAVACGGDGRVLLYDTKTLTQFRYLNVGEDADNVRYDSKRHRLFVAVGDINTGALVEMDTLTWTTTREIRFASHPESFQLDPDGDRIYANIPGGVRSLHDGTVAFASRRSGTVTSVVPLVGRGRNFPMALDSKHGRLFIATRRPARLIEIDIASQSVLSETPCSDDSDDLFLDENQNRIWISSGGFRPDLQTPDEASPLTPPGVPGSLDGFDIGHVPPVRSVSVPTAWHARTCLFVPTLKSIFAAIPFREGRDPEVRQYLWR